MNSIHKAKATVTRTKRGGGRYYNETGKREAKEGFPVEKIVKNYSMSVSWKGDGKKVFVNAMRVRCICFNYKI